MYTILLLLCTSSIIIILQNLLEWFERSNEMISTLIITFISVYIIYTRIYNYILLKTQM